MSVLPPWQSLTVSQADLSLLFTNSSPFSFSQSLLLMPPVGADSKPVLHATFGPYSVTQVHFQYSNIIHFNLYWNWNKYLSTTYLPLFFFFLQLVSETLALFSLPIVAYLLSKTIKQKWEPERGEGFTVRVLFHLKGDSNRGKCVILHAFKQTEEQKASCIAQVLPKMQGKFYTQFLANKCLQIK